MAVRLKSANWQPDLSNWSDILADRLPLLKDSTLVLKVYNPRSDLTAYSYPLRLRNLWARPRCVLNLEHESVDTDS